MNPANTPIVSSVATAEIRDLARRSRRARIVDAALRLLATRGFHPRPPTVADMVSLAGVARNTFYENFPNADEAFLAATTLALGNLAEVLDGSDTDELLAWVHRNPDDAVVALIHSPAVNQEGWMQIYATGADSLSDELQIGGRLQVARTHALAYFDVDGIREGIADLPRQRGRSRARSAMQD